MSQALLLRKLAKFLELTNPKDTVDLQNELKAGGHCFGFALCFAAMIQQNKLAWWETLLHKIANWDETEGSLDQELSLPQAIVVKSEKKTEEKTIHNSLTLRSHMERVVNYVFYQHAGNGNEKLKTFIVTGLSQLAITKPIRIVKNEKDGKEYEQPSHFEMTSETKKIVHTKERKYVTQYCSDEFLVEFLKKNKEKFKQFMCTTCALDHRTALYFDGKKWLYYDPNYDHTSLGSMHKEFEENALMDLVKAIKKSFEDSTIGIEFVSFDGSIHLDMPVEKSSHDKFKEVGLSAIAKRIPESLLGLLEEEEKTKEGQLTIAKGLAYANATTSGSPGLGYVISYAPGCLAKVIDIGFKNPETTEFLFDALLLKTSLGTFYYEYLETEKCFSNEFKTIKSNLVKLLPVGRPKYQNDVFKGQLRAFITKMIKSGVNINTDNVTGYGTFLHFAAAINDAELAKYLIDNGADMNCKNSDGKTPLQVIPSSPSETDCSKYLKGKILETLDMKMILDGVARHSLDIKSLNITSVFYKAGSLRIPDAQKPMNEEERKTVAAIHEVVSALIKAGANLNGVDAKGNTILHLAVMTNHVTLFKELAQNPDIEYKQNGVSDTPLDEAKKMLSVHPEILSTPSPLSLDNAIRNLDITAIKTHLDKKNLIKTINIAEIYNKMIAKFVPEKKRFEILKLLLEAGADVNKADRNGDTALHWAAYHNDEKLFCLLVTYKANINLKNNYGRTSLEEGRLENGVYLNTKIEIMADPNKIQTLSKTVEKITLDFKEEKAFNFKSLKSLFAGFCYDEETAMIKDCDDNTILHLAVMTNQPDIVADVIKHYKNVNPLNKNGLTPIQAGLAKFGKELNPKIIAMLSPVIDTLDMKRIIDEDEVGRYSLDLKSLNITLVFYKSGFLCISDPQKIMTDEERRTIAAIHEVASLLIKTATLLGNPKFLQYFLEKYAFHLAVGRTPLEYSKGSGLNAYPPIRKLMLNRSSVAPKKSHPFANEDTFQTCQALFRDQRTPSFFSSRVQIPMQIDENIALKSIQEIYDELRDGTRKSIKNSGTLLLC